MPQILIAIHVTVKDGHLSGSNQVQEHLKNPHRRLIKSTLFCLVYLLQMIPHRYTLTAC